MPAEIQIPVEQQVAMADYVAASVVDDATGRSDSARCVGEPPSAHYYLGTLAPADIA